MASRLQNIPVGERISLVEDLWDSIAADQSGLPLTQAQKAELERRLNAYATDRNPGRKADEAIAGVRCRP